MAYNLYSWLCWCDMAACVCPDKQVAYGNPRWCKTLSTHINFTGIFFNKFRGVILLKKATISPQKLYRELSVIYKEFRAQFKASCPYYKFLRTQWPVFMPLVPIYVPVCHITYRHVYWTASHHTLWFWSMRSPTRHHWPAILLNSFSKVVLKMYWSC